MSGPGNMIFKSTSNSSYNCVWKKCLGRYIPIAMTQWNLESRTTSPNPKSRKDSGQQPGRPKEHMRIMVAAPETGAQGTTGCREASAPQPRDKARSRERATRDSEQQSANPRNPQCHSSLWFPAATYQGGGFEHKVPPSPCETRLAESISN